MATVEIKEGDKFVVTGTLRNGKRFKAMTFSSFRHANSINLWRGSLWLLRDGKRTLLKSVWN